jgi:nucleoredoxin
MKTSLLKQLSAVVTLAAILAASPLHASLTTLLPEQLRTAGNEVVERASLDGKIVGLYFSASWCPPCRNFTPALVKLRDANADNFEVVLVGFDRGAPAHWKYMSDYKMNFLSMVPGSRESQTLAERFGVRGIPHLTIIGPDGRVINQNAVSEVSRNGDAAIQRWKASAAD